MGLLDRSSLSRRLEFGVVKFNAETEVMALLERMRYSRVEGKTTWSIDVRDVLDKCKTSRFVRLVKASLEM